jgi:hypothetical protein
LAAARAIGAGSGSRTAVWLRRWRH